MIETPAVGSPPPLRLLLTGYSKAGKTYTSMLLANALCEAAGIDPRVPMENGVHPIVVIDSEPNHPSSYYYCAPGEEGDEKRICTFSRILIDTSDNSPKKYVAAVREASRSGAHVIIIDSASREWDGDKGALAMGDGRFSNWNAAKREHHAFIHAVLASDAHTISLMKMKDRYQQIDSKVVKDDARPVTERTTPFDYDEWLNIVAEDGKHYVEVLGTRRMPWRIHQIHTDFDELFEQICLNVTTGEMILTRSDFIDRIRNILNVSEKDVYNMLNDAGLWDPEDYTSMWSWLRENYSGGE